MPLLPQACAYCRETEAEAPSLNLLLPRVDVAIVTGDSEVWACRACTNSKGDRDMLSCGGGTPRMASPLCCSWRYLAVMLGWCTARGLLEESMSEVGERISKGELPLGVAAVAMRYPTTGEVLGVQRLRWPKANELS